MLPTTASEPAQWARNQDGRPDPRAVDGIAELHTKRPEHEEPNTADQVHNAGRPPPNPPADTPNARLPVEPTACSAWSASFQSMIFDLRRPDGMRSEIPNEMEGQSRSTGNLGLIVALRLYVQDHDLTNIEVSRPTDARRAGTTADGVRREQDTANEARRDPRGHPPG
jgi:hypothetical protein